MEQFKVHVERIVRPVQAALARKNKMREELLAHLVHKAEALVDEGLDEPAASAQAVEQLGDPDVIRKELQASVPALERLACARIPNWRFLDAYFEKDEGESRFHFALVRTAFEVSAMAVCVLPLLVAKWAGFMSRGQSSCLSCSLAAVGFISVAAVFIFVGWYLTDMTGLRRAMSRETAAPAWRKGVATCVFLCFNFVLIIGPLLFLAWLTHPSGRTILTATFFGMFGLQLAGGTIVLLVLLSVVCGFAMKIEHEQWVKWGSLKIDD